MGSYTIVAIHGCQKLKKEQNGVGFAGEEREEEADDPIFIVIFFTIESYGETEGGDQYGQQVDGYDADPESVARSLELLIQQEDQRYE